MVSQLPYILKTNLKHNFKFPFLLTIIFICFIPVIVNVKGLDAVTAAKPLETLFSLSGILLLTPICFPEQNSELRDVVSCKKISYATVCLIRVLYSVSALSLFSAGFVLYMSLNESCVTLQHVLCAFISAYFIGSLGLAAAVLSKNMIVGLMVSLLYYVANFGGHEVMGNFYLFSMSMGSFQEKINLLAAGIVCSTAALLFIKK